MPYLHILETVLLGYASEDILFATFLHFSGQEELIKDKICLLKVEYDIQFADVAVIFVHLLHVAVNNFQRDKFVVGRVATCDEEEGGVATIYDFRVWYNTVSTSKGRSARGWKLDSSVTDLCTRGSCTCVYVLQERVERRP